MSEYNESSIKVLDDIEHIQQRPYMYISSERPMNQMFNEVLDNALDEAMCGYADCIRVSVDYEDNVFSVTDNGRGIPQGINKELNKPTPEVIYTKLNSGGKFDTGSYAFSGGLHGAGSVVVNALSKELYVCTWRPSETTEMKFEYGKSVSFNHWNPVKENSGTHVYCRPNLEHKIFNDRLIDYKKDIEDRLSLITTLLPNLKIVYNDNPVVGKSFKEFVHNSKDNLFDEAIELSYKNLHLAINWSVDTNKCVARTYCNMLHNPLGGDHAKGVYDAVTEYAGSSDYTLGLNMVVSIMYPSVEYDSQAKLKAVSKDMRAYVKETVVWLLKKYFKSNPGDWDKLSELVKRKRNEIDKRNNKSTVRRTRRNIFLSSLGSTNFSDCTTKNREDAELYICEGNSAAGSAIQARNVETQAIMPIRGKIINAEKCSVASLLNNAEVSTILASINAGMFQDVNLQEARYGKIIIFADADEDGKNISCLLIALFMYVLPELVEAGYLYIALPPLYGTHVKGKFIPINTEEEKQDYLDKGYEIQRYKGLGEMNPEQLSVSCMNPKTRNLLHIKTSEECRDIVTKIMGGSSAYRKDILREVGVLDD